MVECDGTHLDSQHLGGESRQISVNPWPAWSTEKILDQIVLHSEAPFQKPKEMKKGMFHVSHVLSN